MYYATLKTKSGTYTMDAKTFLGGIRTEVSESEYYNLLGNDSFKVEAIIPKVTESPKEPEETQKPSKVSEPDMTPEEPPAKPKKPSKKAQSVESK